MEEVRPEEVIMYLRKSRTDDPALSVSETLSKHEQMLDDFSLRVWGEPIPERNRFREIVSGETIASRPEIQKVLRLIEQDCFKALLIVEPQRLSRGDLEDIGRLSKLLRYTHTSVITLQYRYNLTDDRDREYFERELKRGNEYLQYSKRIMQNGIRLSVESGNYVGSSAPYGYRTVARRDGKRTAHTLEIVQEQADAVRLIYSLYLSGHGATVIANTLNASGIPPARADKWIPAAIYPILDNPHYCGLIKWNGRKTVVTVSDGDIRKSRPHAEPELYEGKHEAIIDRDTWERVRRMRTERHLPKVRSSLDIQNPLAGLLYCECGSAMVQSVPKGRSRRVYCRNQPICGNAGCATDILLAMIADALKAELENIVVSEDAEADTVKIDMLKSRIEVLKKKEDALWEKYAEGMPKETFDRLLSKNAEAIQLAESSLTEEEEAANKSAAKSGFSVSLHEAIDALVSDAPVKALNGVLRACIAKIVYSRRPAIKAQENGNRGGWKASEPMLTITLNL